jgi:ElaB/YqjD/DUF883 family membrane-anchored ribosome-binding protein
MTTITGAKENEGKMMESAGNLTGERKEARREEGRPAEGWGAAASDAGTELGARVQSLASNVANRAQSLASDVASRAQDMASSAADKTSSTIREYPLQSLVAGFGLGCVVGFLISRR